MDYKLVEKFLTRLRVQRFSENTIENYKSQLIYANGKATEGLVQQGFCNSVAKLQSSTAVLRFNCCAKLKICASITPPSQSPKTLCAILSKTPQK